MKILMHSSFPFSMNSGVGRVVAQLSAELRSLGADVDLMFGSSAGNGGVKVATYLDLLRGPLKVLRHTSLTSIPFSLRIGKAEYDIIHSHTPESALDPMLSGAVDRTRLLVHLHGHDKLVHDEWCREVAGGKLPYDAMTDFYLRASIGKAKRVFAGCTNFTAISKSVVAETEREYGVSPVLIRNGFIPAAACGGPSSSVPKGMKTGAAALRKELGLEGRRVVLFVGTNAWRKGLPYLVEAMGLLPSDFVLVAVGLRPHEFEPISRRFPQAFRGGRVVPIPETPNASLSSYYSMADVFCMPSLYEPFGLVYLEALDSGVPCVGSLGTGAQDIIADGKNGFLVEKRNVVQLASAIEKAAGFTRKTKFDTGEFRWGKSAKKLMRVYDSIVSGNGTNGMA